MIEFKDYKLHDEVSIGPYTFKVHISKSKTYYLNELNDPNYIIFDYLGVKGSSYVEKIVGHELRGDFPEVKTLEDLNKVIKQLQIDCLLKEAKEKYPVGVVFRSIFNKFDYTSSGKFKWIPEDMALRDVEVYGVVWNWNEWAEIITEEPKQPEINTYALKVGDRLPANIICEWSGAGNNRYDGSAKWYKRKGMFHGDRTILGFKVIQDVIGFLVSDTSVVYLKAEGFKEFAESFDKPKFEVGKWYKRKHYSYAIKYLKEKVLNSKYAIIYSDIIYGNKNYESCPEGRIGVGYTDDAGWYELTDLSEVQQYLPDGHPDKIKTDPEYIVGKWYRLGARIGKFRKLDGDRFCVFKSGTPSYNYKFPDGGHLSIKCQGTPVLITDMTEVYRLFPEEKPDDSKSYSLNYKFKVGDIVEIVKSGSGYGEGCLGEQVTILKLGEYNNNPGYKTTKTLGDSNANAGYLDGMAGEESFKLIQSHDDDDFEVNDWVVVESWHYAKILLPQTCQISRIESWGRAPYVILLNEDHYGDNETWYFKKGEFRHATSEEVDREIERRQLIKSESPRITQIVKSVMGRDEPFALKSSHTDTIALKDQQVPELTITIKTNKTNKLFINSIKTITL